MNVERITSKQSLRIGSETAGIVHDLGLPKDAVQAACENQSHPLWGKMRNLFIETFPKGEATEQAAPQASSIFKDVCDLTIPPQPRFIAAENFKKGNATGVQFWDFGSNFTSWCLPLIEEPTLEMVAAVRKLRERANHGEMTPHLGEQRILTLSQLFWMFSQQPKGEKPNDKNRRLLTNGYTNILRVLGMEGIERAVLACWGGGHGWHVSANDLERDFKWGAGVQALSRK